MTDVVRHHVQARSRRTDRIEFRLLMVLSFPFFLLATCAARLMRERAPASGGSGGSVFAEARAAAASAIPFAFMG